MDGTTLQNLFSQGNPFLAQMGEQAFNLDQQKQQATLAQLMGNEKRAQEMQPLEMQHRQALTRQGNANAATVEDSLAAQAPAADRMKAAMQALHAKANDAERAQRDADMYERMQRASVIKANGGQIPLYMQNQIPKEELPYYTGKGLDLTLALGKAYHDTHPKTMEARAKEEAAYKRATDVASMGANARVQAAGMSKGSGGGQKAPKSPRELMSYYDYKANLAETPEEQQHYQRLAQEQELLLQKELILRAQAGTGGKIDPATTANTGTVTTNPMPTPAATPRGGQQWTPPAGWK